MLSIFGIFKLHGGWLPFMLVPCCFGDVVNVITRLWHTYVLLKEVVLFLNMYYFFLIVGCRYI